MRDEIKLHWLWLAEKCGTASKEFVPLIEKFENPFEIYRLDSEATDRIPDISDRLRHSLADKSLEKSYRIYNYCAKNGIGIITYEDGRYPERLKTLPDPPVLFYVRGKFPELDSRPAIGIVGTRKMSEYGKRTAYKISYELSAAGFIVVSGMALGIDGVASAAAIAAKAEQVAVLGCGVDVTYPRQHAKLMEQIIKNGAVISEYPPGEPPNGYNFPKRNRIISGLSKGVLVVEGAAGSGSLITAEKAIAQGRTVFALPGKINESNSQGPNELIKNGAYVVSGTDDIIGKFEFLYADRINYRDYKKSKQNSEPDEKLLNKLGVSGTEYQNTAKSPAGEGTPDASEEPRAAKPFAVRAEKSEGPAAKSAAPKAAKSARTETDAAREKALAGLDPVSRAIYEKIPAEGTVSVEEITGWGHGVGEVLTSLTMLEIMGLVKSVPGGAYARA